MQQRHWLYRSITFLFVLLTAAGAGVAPAGENDGLVGYYSFNDCTPADESGTGNNGAVVGSGQCVPGVNGSALRFGGPYAPGYVTIANSPSLSFLDNYTFTMWFNIQNNTSMDGYGRVNEYGIQTIFAKAGDRNGLDLRTVRAADDGKLYLFAYSGWCCGGGPGSGFYGTDRFGLNEWHLATVTSGNGSVDLYLDCKLQGSMPTEQFSVNPAMASMPLQLGIDQAAMWYPINGMLDDARVYNRALDPAEINALYRSAGRGACPGACIDPPQNMIGWWSGDGHAYDLAGSAHGAAADGATFSAGKVSQAFDLNGTGGYVRVPDRPALVTPDGMTVDAWINPRSFGGAEVIASKWDDPTGQWSWIFKLHNDGTGRLRIEISRGDHNALGDLGGTTVLPLNAWSHVAATYDRETGSMRLYVNGKLDSEGTASYPGTAISGSTADILIGAVNGQTTPPGEFFNGLIDEVELFNRALTAEEIASVYQAGSAGKCKPANLAPAANAGVDQLVEVTSCAGAEAALDGTASFDPDGDALAYTWSENGTVIATGATARVTLAAGSHPILLTVDDGKGGTSTNTVVITVADTAAPALTVTMNPNTLWPPNHKYVTVTPSITVADACAATVTVKLVSTMSSEPDSGVGRKDRPKDIVVNADGTLKLRAERSGKGSGRVYTMTYQATDAGGNTTTATAVVTVPHARGGSDRDDDECDDREEHGRGRDHDDRGHDDHDDNDS